MVGIYLIQESYKPSIFVLFICLLLLPWVEWKHSQWGRCPHPPTCTETQDRSWLATSWEPLPVHLLFNRITWSSQDFLTLTWGDWTETCRKCVCSLNQSKPLPLHCHSLTLLYPSCSVSISARPCGCMVSTLCPKLSQPPAFISFSSRLWSKCHQLARQTYMARSCVLKDFMYDVRKCLFF